MGQLACDRAPDCGQAAGLQREGQEVLRQALEAARAGDQAALARHLGRMAVLQENIDCCHNFAVVNITSPANLFHALRRQVHRAFAKPLVMLSAKYLLHHGPCRSPLKHMAEGTRFQRLIIAGGSGDNVAKTSSPVPSCRRLVFCSGKVFYELHHALTARHLEDQVVLARLEQVAPFPSMEVATWANFYPDAELVWVQEEPKNMGAWSYVAPRFAASLRQLSPEAPVRHLRYVGRPPAASPATALFKQHKKEVRAIMDEALSFH